MEKCCSDPHAGFPAFFGFPQLCLAVDFQAKREIVVVVFDQWEHCFLTTFLLNRYTADEGVLHKPRRIGTSTVDAWIFLDPGLTKWCMAVVLKPTSPNSPMTIRTGSVNMSRQSISTFFLNVALNSKAVKATQTFY